MNRRRTRIGPLTILLLAFLVNLPIVHGWWTERSLDRDGRQTTAAVTQLHAVPPDAPEQRYFVAYRLPEEVDPDRREYSAEVHATAYDAAQLSREIVVTYLPGNPGENRAAGRVPAGRMAIAITAAADLVLLAILALMIWVRRTQDLVLFATADLVRCKPEETVRELVGDEYLVRGDVLETNDSEVVLAVQERRITIVLGAFSNPIGHQQPAEARGRKQPPG